MRGPIPSSSPITPLRTGGYRTARPHPTPHVIPSAAPPHVILNVAKRSEESIAPHNQPRLSHPVSSRRRGPIPLPLFPPTCHCEHREAEPRNLAALRAQFCHLPIAQNPPLLLTCPHEQNNHTPPPSSPSRMGGSPTSATCGHIPHPSPQFSKNKNKSPKHPDPRLICTKNKILVPRNNSSPKPNR